MARTGRRARELKALLERAGWKSRQGPQPPRPTGADHAEELLALYRSLGGTGERPQLKPGGWDLLFADGVVVELDEELHFNRYRTLTLQSSWSEQLPWTGAYLQFCAEHELACLKGGSWGKRWSSPSSTRMFAGGPPRALDGDGAPRWKQRALYDAVKDTAPSTDLDLVLSRVSIYDSVGDTTLGAVLDLRAAVEPEAVAALVRSRAARS